MSLIYQIKDKTWILSIFFYVKLLSDYPGVNVSWMQIMYYFKSINKFKVNEVTVNEILVLSKK